MATTQGSRSARFSFVSSAHQFLLDVLPFREPESGLALESFVQEASSYPVASAIVDAVLLRCLTVLGKHMGDPLPSLVDSYLSRGRHEPDPWGRFTECVSDALKYRGVGDISVQQAIAVIEQRYGESTLAPRTIAALVGRRRAALSDAFKRHTGTTLSEYIRRIRLDHAGKLLTMTTKSIKEIWSQVGYNYGSNFDHDFKRRFGISPREYRARAIHPRARGQALATPASDAPHASGDPRTAILLVDDGASTHSTISRSLRLAGYDIFTAVSGAQALLEVDRVSPDVMLLEYDLPDMSGIDCLRAIRRRHPVQPAVGFFTADWDVYDAAEEIRSLNGVVASKLCDLEGIKELIVRLLQPGDVGLEVTQTEHAGMPG
jgi:AraC-like DNA-binding protein